MKIQQDPAGKTEIVWSANEILKLMARNVSPYQNTAESCVLNYNLDIKSNL